MQRKKSTRDTRNAAYKQLKQQFDMYVEFNTANQRELRELNRMKFEMKRENVALKTEVDRLRREIYELRNSGLYASAEETYEALPRVCEAILNGEEWSI